MNLNWSNRVIKYVLFVFNLLFVISGIIMIAVGVSVKEYYTDYDIFLDGSYFSLPNLLIAIGSLIFFISFFGCCGAIRESWFMIFVFSILLSLIFIMEFSAGIAGYVLRDNTASFLETELQSSMKNYMFNANNDANPTTKMWDTIQFEFRCCGATGPSDWISIPRPATSTQTSPTAPPTSSTVPPTSSTPTSTSQTTTTTTKTTDVQSTSSISTQPSSDSSVTSIPDTSSITPSENSAGRRKRDVKTDAPNNLDLPFSCCKSNPGATGPVICKINDTQTATYYDRGCVDGFGDYLKDHAVTIGGVGIAIALIQLFGVIFACHLARQLKHGFYST